MVLLVLLDRARLSLMPSHIRIHNLSTARSQPLNTDLNLSLSIVSLHPSRHHNGPCSRDMTHMLVRCLETPTLAKQLLSTILTQDNGRRSNTMSPKLHKMK